MTEPLLIRPKTEDIAGQPILRPLPSVKCRSVGPFVFFDHILEQDYPPGTGMDIAQHPHIGLSTLTYCSPASCSTRTAWALINSSNPVTLAG